MKKVFTKFSAFNALIWTACLAILGGMVAGAIVLFGPVDVLRNWNMSVGGESKTFAVEQTVYFSSESEKLMSVEGHSDRYLICDAKGQLIEREVALSTIPATRPAGVNPERKNAITMPKLEAFNDEQGNSTLPRICKLHINACYTVYGFRTHCEQSETEKFTVVANLEEGQDDNNYDEVGDIEPIGGNQQQSQTSVPRNTSQNTTTTSTTTNNTTTNNNTTNESDKCAVDVNIIGLIPVKLGCN